MKLIDLIICDDIRREEGSKRTLVGCYNDKIEITIRNKNQIPFSFKLCFYSRFKITDKNNIPDSFKLNLKFNSKNIIDFGGQINVEDSDKLLVLEIQCNNFPVSEGGELIPEFSFFKGDEFIDSFRPDYPFKFIMHYPEESQGVQ